MRETKRGVLHARGVPLREGRICFNIVNETLCCSEVEGSGRASLWRLFEISMKH